MKLIIAAVLIVNITCCTIANADLLYDIDFSSPLNQVGSQMTITSDSSLPLRTASKSNFGQQIVMSQWGSLNDQPVVLIPCPIGGSAYYSQMQLNMSQFNYQSYKVNFDICFTQMEEYGGEGFVFFFDVPVVVRLNFTNDGRILANDQYLVDRFSLNEKLSMSILVDLQSNLWNITCNSNGNYTGQFFYTYPAFPTLPTYVSSLRFSTIDYNINNNIIPSPAIDNIKVYGIPEPATLLLLGLGGLFLRRKR